MSGAEERREAAAEAPGFAAPRPVQERDTASRVGGPVVYSAMGRGVASSMRAGFTSACHASASTPAATAPRRAFP